MSTCHLLCPWSWVVTLDLHYLRQPGNIQSRQGANTGDQTYLVFNPETKWRDLTNTLEVGASSAYSARSTAEHLESLYQQQAHMIRVLQAPKFNLPVFVGDAMPLIRAFEDSMERTLPDNSFCFARLVQLCTGYAARVINCCTLMPPDQGYQSARHLLKQWFGDEFEFSQLWVKKLLIWTLVHN